MHVLYSFIILCNQCYVLKRIFKVLFVCLLVLCHGNHITRQDELIINWIKHAEDNLRIYIYPIPNLRQNEDTLSLNSSELNNNSLAESVLINYFLSLHTYGNSQQQQMIVTNPDEANAFIINHHWTQEAVAFPSCSDFYENYLFPIVDNVIMKQHFFNRSHGNNHFIIMTSENGLFARSISDPCFNDEKVEEIRRLLSNVSQITYHSKDLKLPPHIRSHQSDRNNEMATFIVNKDIVIPPPLERIHTHDNALHYDWILSRPWDSAWFDEITSEDQNKMASIVDKATTDYIDNHLEKFYHSLEYSSAYFVYSPCARSYCWSTKLYEGLKSKSIPILVGSNIIMPFEKFVPWSGFTVKVSTETWRNASSGKFQEIRKKMRYECDKFRHIVDLFRLSLKGNIRDHIEGEPTSNKHLGARLKGPSDETRSYLKSVHESLIYKKMLNIHRNFGWLFWNSTADHNLPLKHPFKLIQLEIYCRVTTHEERAMPTVFVGDVEIVKKSSFVITSRNDPCLWPPNKLSTDKIEYIYD